MKNKNRKSIPKIINYCWFGSGPESALLKRCKESWKRFCPDFEIRRWDESNYAYLEDEFSKQAYLDKNWAFVSDLARLKIIYEHGGIYLDADVELIRGLDPLLSHECYLGQQQEGFLCNTGLGFGATPKHKVIGRMIQEYENLEYDASKKDKFSCPILNTKALVSLGFKRSNQIEQVQGAVIFPPEYFDPIAPGSNSRNLMTSNTYSIHQYANSWGGWQSSFRRKIYTRIGVQRIDKVKDWINRNR